MPVKSDKILKPEVIAAIMAAIAAYGFPQERGYRVTSIRKKGNLWKKTGLREAVLERGIWDPSGRRGE